MAKVLMVVTSHSKLGDTGNPTGYWQEEFAAPYYLFKDAGFAVTIASPLGGEPPCDPKSLDAGFQTKYTERLNGDAEAKKQLASTVKLETVKEQDYTAIFYPGGHGPMYDLKKDKHSIALIEAFASKNKAVGAVCHGPAVLAEVKLGGSPLVKGRKMTGFTNAEELAV
eukprot:CAMPEP_0170623596 /NCGR_PEP_ID=MMETSP0224-20130122/29782_1 /TAXON_ID=285029 /ORGANISM="Togula jolla, Strain CCCM 725" /LENGTH=167 /DNA_ID=CAMNT_0010950059 /DNA_START=60 /DNA_END=559 /DNA_ORIENTATION=+